MNNILILGSGSREHILAKTYLKGNIKHVFISPGNKYINDKDKNKDITCINIDYDNLSYIIYIENNITSCMYWF